jgi:uncharacterized protein YdhG (YjbR/CyaY superfamily)
MGGCARECRSAVAPAHVIHEKVANMSEEGSGPGDVDSYIARSREEARPKLEELREIVRSTIPDAHEGISWGVPFYKHHGLLAGFSAYKNHVSFGVADAVLPGEVRDELEDEGYVTGKKTIQIRFDQEVPTAAIERVLRTTAELNEARSAKG